MEIRLKTRRHVIPASRFVVKFNIEGAPVYDVAWRVAEAMIAEIMSRW